MYSMLTSTIPILLSHGAHASIPPTSPLTERQPSQQYVYNFIIPLYLSF